MAEGDVLVFFDDDVSFPVDLFARLERAYEDPQIVGVTGQIVEPRPHRVGGVGSPLRRWLLGGVEEGRFTSFGYPRYVENPERVREVEYMLGCFMTARREQARRVRFDESLGGYALFEDEDFSYRLSHEGRIRYLPDLVVHHDKFGFASKDPREFNRLVVRNRSYLFHKNFARTRLASLQFGLLLALLLGHRLMNREWRAAQGLLEGVASLWAPRLGRQ